jgi:putative DNA primase/helicase
MASASWESCLLKNKQGAYLPCTSNVTAILTHTKEWRDVLTYDAFAGEIVTRKVPPWCEDTVPEKPAPGDWTHEDTIRTCVWVTREWNCPVNATTVAEAVQIVARLSTIHPVRDRLNETKWDRKARLDTHLIRCAEAPDTLYVRAVTKNFFLGAVARVMQPGEKVDTMLILEGNQGIGKSTWFRLIAGEEWFLETSIDIGSKDGYQALRRKWIIELGELDSLNRGEVSRVKQFLTAVKDTYRPSYGKSMIDFPRQCVFGGSVNPDGGGYLKDGTGARRFWPVPVGKIDLKAVREERAQLWAEAMFRYRQCEKWHLRDPRLLKAAADEAEQRRQTDPWEEHFAHWLQEHARVVKGVTTTEMMSRALDMPKDRQGRGEQMRAAQALRAIGWDDIRQNHDGQRRYHPNKSWKQPK